MKSLKTVSIIVLITIILINLIYTKTKPKTLNNKTKEVVFWSLQMGTFNDYMNPLINEFEQQHPDIKIKWIDVPYAEGEKRTLASILSNTPPDLVNLTPDFSSVLAQKQALEYIDCSKLKNYNQQIVNIFKKDEKCYAIPFYATSSITLYNKDIFKNSNIYQIPKTYDDLFTISKNIKNKTNKFVTMPTLTENDTFLKILNKYDINNADKLTTEKAYAIFDQYKTLYKNDLIPKESITQNHQEALEKYMSGQLALIQTGANFLNIIKENAPQVFQQTDVANQLIGDNSKYDVSVMNLIIPAKAKNKNEALEFAIFLTNKKNQIELAKLTTILPVNNEALNDKYFTDFDKNDIISKARFLSSQQLKNLQEPVKLKNNHKDLINLINSKVQQIILEKTTTQEGIKELQKQWKEIE